MSAIIPFNSGAKLPAYMANRAALAAINADVPAGGPSDGKLSIKGRSSPWSRVTSARC